uniref:Uncharacterized protein n=1 Tax=Fagus sylvatica TaxID=28930 RepID=A0A2N9HBS5_FAGSY
MAPGSRGAGAVFARFSGEDSGQTGEATGEPRVSRCSWSFHLSNAPGPARQLVASRKDSVREGGCPGEKRAKLSAHFSLLFVFVLNLWETELWTERYGPANRGLWSVFGPSEGIFPVRIPARPGKVLAIREFHTVHECVLFSTCLGLRINLLGELGFPRYDLANRGRWNVPYAEGSFSDRDSGLTGGVLDDPGIARTAKNLPQFACHSLSDALALNRLTHGSKVKVGFRFLVFTQNSTFPTSAFSFPSSSDLALRKFVRLSEYEVYLAFLALGLPVALSCRCLTEAVVAEIVAGPHALDSCECMNIEDAMRASLRWLLLCLLGRSALASHTLGLAISQESASVSTSMPAECVYDERFPSNFLESLNTTHGLVEPRRKNCPSIKVETGAWPSFSYGQRSTKASVWDCVWAFSGQGMLFEGSLGRKCSTFFRLGNMFSRTIIYLDVAAAGIKSTRNCNCKPITWSKYGFFRGIDENLDHLLSRLEGGHARGRHFLSTMLELRPYWARKVSASSFPMGDLLQLVNTIQAACLIKLPWKVWINKGSLFAYWAIFQAAHLQVNHQVTPPIVLLEFRDFEFGRHCHVGELGHIEGICVPKELRPRLSRIFSSKPSILLSNWGSLPSGFGSVGGLGSGSMLM